MGYIATDIHNNKQEMEQQQKLKLSVLFTTHDTPVLSCILIPFSSTKKSNINC